MAAEDRWTNSIGGLGDVRRQSSGNASISIRSLPAFGDVLIAGGLNISAHESRLKMKNNKALVINEGVLASSKKITPKIKNGKEIIDGSLKFDKHLLGAMDVNQFNESGHSFVGLKEMSGSSSRGMLDPHFQEADDQAAYHYYKECGITLSRTINPANLSYPLSTTGNKLHSLIFYPDFDWSTANHFLRHTNVHFHVGETSSLLKDARTIQHVLRTSLIPKVGDRVHITPLLSLTTFYILAHREFNSTDMIFHYIEHLTTIRDTGHKRKPNLALGHIIAYVLESKYNLQYLVPPNHPPPFYTNNSFNALHSTHLHPRDGEAQGAEKEEAPAPAHVPEPVPLCQHS
ncbi:hypothetical protein MA16_Dca011082 [Dendrobium catenatum]|uniref:Uncharacterized protein n=1 Tax=Dendrobium catenatum TaxID=906689 RepID=A0A2I0W3K2_9ASPA|nr:hypothetical protein MA16_Dca011082 [Dendrobium catenatum]